MIKIPDKGRHHLNLLCDVSELAALLAGSENIENFFQRTVAMVAGHMKAKVCSLYLLDEQSVELTLRATTASHPDATDRIRLKMGEGRVGATLEKLQPVIEGAASDHPGFQRDSKTGEISLNSFLAVPVVRGHEKIGVLVVQHQDQDYFDEVDVMALRTIASQLAGAVGNARLLIGATGKEKNGQYTHRLSGSLGPFTGQVAVYGSAFGPATVFDKSHDLLDSVGRAADSNYSLTDFHRAVQDTIHQLQQLQSRFARRLAESAALIFTAHLMILKDVRFIREMEQLIKNGAPVPAAIQTVARHYIDLFGASPYGHIRDKANDVKDLAGRLLKNLLNDDRPPQAVGENRIVIAPELYPSDVLRLASDNIEGIILIRGGITSHVAIVAHSLQIPLMIVNRPELLQLPEGTLVLIDGENGTVHVRPSEGVIKRFRSQQQALTEPGESPPEISPVTMTADGIRVRLLANINLLGDLVLARQLKAEGVGLFRTEFPFLVRSAAPSEEEQLNVYRRLFDEMPGKEVVIRLLDTGSDKLLAYAEPTAEDNPALGLRATRFLFRHLDIFQLQVRAILRAAAGAAKPHILFPMIASIDDFLAARQVVYDCMAQLARNNLAHHPRPLLGALIEIPSVIEVIDALVSEADFLSIGTNDFIQYMLAADRNNAKVAEYYQPHHPAVLRSLAKVARSAVYHHKEVSICGELAHDANFIPFWLGIGIRTLSVYPKFLPAVQKRINDLRLADAESFAERMLGETSLKVTEQLLQQSAKAMSKHTKGK